MAYIPDELIYKQYAELSPVAVVLFNYYCAKRNKKNGGWNCPMSTVLSEMKGLTESSYFRAKKELISKGWITAKKDFITPIFESNSIKNDSISDFETTKFDSRTIKFESETPIFGGLPNKEDRARFLPTHITSQLDQEKETTNVVSKKIKRLVSFPEDFQLTEKMREWATSKGYKFDLTEETELFIDHHKGKDSRFADWNAAWRTWMRRAQSYFNQQPKTISSPEAQMQSFDGYTPKKDMMSLHYEVDKKSTSFRQVVDVTFDAQSLPATIRNFEKLKCNFLGSNPTATEIADVENYEHSEEYRKRFG